MLGQARGWSNYARSQNCNMKMLQRLLIVFPAVAAYHLTSALAADIDFNGLGVGMGKLFLVSRAQSRSISPENFTGEAGKAGMATEGTGKGAARDLGRGW